MDGRRRAAHQLALKRLRERLVQAGPARIEPNRQDPATTGVADEDAQALSEMLQALASQRNAGQAEQLARIDRALRKLATAPEEYGLCERCEEEIAPGRLALMPYASLCTECQSSSEPRRMPTRRSLRRSS